MATEVFFTLVEETAGVTVDQLKAVLQVAALVPKALVWEDMLWLEFDGFESRLVLSNEEAPQALITLEFCGDLSRETPLIEKLEAVLEAQGYANAEELSTDEN